MLVVLQVSSFVPVVLLILTIGAAIFWVIVTLETAEQPFAAVTNKL